MMGKGQQAAGLCVVQGVTGHGKGLALGSRQKPGLQSAVNKLHIIELPATAINWATAVAVRSCSSVRYSRYNCSSVRYSSYNCN